MDTVTLQSRVGGMEFTRRVRLFHPETKKPFYDAKTFRFNIDNGFKCAVPKEVWESLRDEYLDRKANLRYREALLPL